MAKYSKVDTHLRVSFYQEEIFTFRCNIPSTALTQGANKNYFFPRMKKKIEEKWLYIFWSKKNVYPISPHANTGAFNARIRYQVYAGQSMAKYGKGQKNPPQTNDQAEHVLYECYFGKKRKDGSVPLRFRNISKYGKNVSRYKRRRGKFYLSRSETLKLPLVRRGEKIRYYFLLSSIQLGNKALTAATEKGGADGLSIWALDSRNGFTKIHEVRGPAPEDMKKWRKDNSSLYNQIREIGVVDPYHLAADIDQNMLENALTRYHDICERFQKGKMVPGFINSKYPDIQNAQKHKGTIMDMYAMANLLIAYQKQYKKENKGKDPYKGSFDKDKAQEVIRFVNNIKKHMRNTSEVCALFLGNWLTSKAHQLIDIAATEDTTEPKDPMAANDRAYALAHWYSMTTFLGFTSHGAGLVAQISKANPHNAVDKILMRYRKDKLPKGDSIDYETFCKAQTVVPDLVLRWCVTNVYDDGFKEKNRYKRMAKKARDITDIINNIRFFGDPLMTPDPKKAPTPQTIYKQAKPWLANGMVIYKMPHEFIAKFFGDITDPVHMGRIHKRVQWAFSENAPKPLRSVLNTIRTRKGGLGILFFDAHEKILKLRVGKLNLFAAIANLLLGQGETVQKLTTSKGWNRAKAGMDMFVAVAETADAACAVAGVEPAKFKEIMQTLKSRAPKNSLASVAKGGLMPVVGIISSGWLIFSSGDAAYKSWNHDDYSSVLGHSIALTGGLFLLANGLWVFFKIPVWLFLAARLTGFIGFLIFLVGTFIVALWMETEWEKYLEHSIFSKDPGLSGKRKFGSKDDQYGKPLPDESWPVRHQRIALMHMISTFTVASDISIQNIVDGGPGGYPIHPVPTVDIQAFWVSIRFQQIDPRVNFKVVIRSARGGIKRGIKAGDVPKTGKKEHTESEIYLNPPDKDHTHWWIDSKRSRYRILPNVKGRWSLDLKPEYIYESNCFALILKFSNARGLYSSMTASVELCRPDKSKIKSDHLLFTFGRSYEQRVQHGSYTFINRSPAGNLRSKGKVICSVAKTFENIKMPAVKI